jgi:hypothetical protein
LSLSSEVEQQTQELANVDKDRLILPVLWMLWLESMHLLWKTTWTLAEIKDNNMIVLPDLIPSFTISDPTTYEFTKLYGEYSGEL